MTGHRQYKVTDYRFGQMLLGLREKVGLTQIEVAGALDISRRTIQHWEAGTGFPDTVHFKNLIEYFLKKGSFSRGSEKEEANALWALADECAARRKTFFDERWFENLLLTVFPPSLPITKFAENPEPQIARIDWGEAPETVLLFGREEELSSLNQWVIQEKCRLVVVLGMGGIGKTALVTRFAQDYNDQFDFIIWRSLRNAPSLEDLLAECFQILPHIKSSKPSIPLLLELFQQHRCLLILDNLETLHRPGKLAGMYREGYEDYQGFFRSIAQTRHKSCLILTSREKPFDLDVMEGINSPLRTLKVAGISSQASQSMLTTHGLYGSPATWGVFVHYYIGNPLALKIAGATVRDLFGGDLATFLREAPVTLLTLSQLLGSQFEQLSALERDILFWLAIERDPVDITTLRSDFLLEVPNSDILAGLGSLMHRSLIERSDQGAIFFLLPVLMEFITDRLVLAVVDQLTNRNTEFILKYALMKSQSIDQVRESQIRMIIHPIIHQLKRSLSHQCALEELLHALILQIRQLPREEQGYAGGNLANLLAQANSSLVNQDLSGLVIRQLYLQGIEAQDADFGNVQFIDSRFTEPLETISAMGLSASGKLLAASTYNGHIRCWNASDGKPIWTVTNATRAWSLSFSPDETMLACSHFRGRVSLWDVSSGRLLHIFEGQGNWVHTLSFDPTGCFLASAGADSLVNIWDIQKKQLKSVLKGHTARIWSLAYSPDGRHLVTSGDEDKILIWNVDEEQLSHTIKQSRKGIYNVATHPGGQFFASCSEHDPHVYIWDLSTGQLLSSVTSISKGLVSLAFNPAGDVLVTGSKEGFVEIWNVANILEPQFLKRLMGHQHHVSVIAISQKNLVATLSYGEAIKLWNLESGKSIRAIEGFSRMIDTNSFSPDGKLLLQGDASGRVRIFDMHKMEYISTFQAHIGPIWTIAFSPDGTIFASAGDDRSIKLWDVETQSCIQIFEGHIGQIWCLEFNSNGTLLASGGSPNSIKIWDTTPNSNRKELFHLDTAFDTWSLAFNHLGDNLASGHTDGSIILWDISSGQQKGSLRQGNVPIGGMRYSSEGKVLLTSSNEVLLMVWNMESMQSIQTIPVTLDDNRTKAIAIGMDARMIATGNGQNVCVWRNTDNPDSIQPVLFQGHTNRIWGLALSPDEHFLATSDEEGTTMIIDLEQGKVIKKVLIDRPYERMNIHGVTGLNLAERSALKALGSIETEPKL